MLCRYEELFVAFVIALFPAILSSTISACQRARLLYSRLSARKHEALQDEKSISKHFGKRFNVIQRLRSDSKKMTLSDLVAFFRLQQDWKAVAERQSLNNEEQQRAYMDFLLVCCEDGPFIVLNLLLIRAMLFGHDHSEECRTWTNDHSPLLIVIIFASSVAALSFKVAHFVLLPKIWKEHKQVKIDQKVACTHVRTGSQGTGSLPERNVVILPDWHSLRNLTGPPETPASSCVGMSFGCS